MLKKLGIFILAFTFALSLTPIVNLPSVTAAQNKVKPASLIALTQKAATKGQSIHAPFIVNESTRPIIRTQWGEPETAYESARVDFYTSRHFTFSYQYDNQWTLATIRDEDPQYQTITIKTLLNTLGNSQSIESSGDEKWYIYHAGNYDIAYVFPSSTKNTTKAKAVVISPAQ
ncbi:protein of unknown function [Seinonella peptonophila]|uniref:DUF4367 domain-containing protein n=1 Tax=Seinonella peptonophila TaxID=112248 RepID=A0A1M4WB90_9BACL|nr:DUF4309 domain-containing protein [Seinonella peptonophila]SHE78504.1 protein of unknown function [Seinonella peptonophila]